MYTSLQSLNFVSLQEPARLFGKDSPLTVFFSTLLGGAMVIVTTLVTQRLSSSRQREEKMWDFQRQTLLDVQTDLNHVARAFFHGDQSYTNEWRRLTVLVERIQDDQVRSMIESFKSEVVVLIKKHQKTFSRS